MRFSNNKNILKKEVKKQKEKGKKELNHLGSGIPFVSKQ